MIPKAHLLLFHAKVKKPVTAESSPVLKPLQVRTRLTEKLQLHLLKFPSPESKVPRGNLVSERFSNLADAKGNLFPGSPLDIFKVYENTLGCLRSKVNRIFCILRHPLECFKHQVKLTNIRKIMFPAGWAGNLMFFNKFHHIFLGPAVHSAA